MAKGTKARRRTGRSGAGRREAVTPGLHLVLGEAGRIVRSAPIRNAPAGFLRPPHLNPRTARALREPFSEVVLDVLRRNGRVLTSFAWPWVGDAFFDGPPGRFPMRGRVLISQRLRLLRVPVPPSAAFLLLSRSDVHFGADETPGPVERTGLTLYSLLVPAPPPPPLPPFAVDLPVQQLPGAAPLVTPQAL